MQNTTNATQETRPNTSSVNPRPVTSNSTTLGLSVCTGHRDTAHRVQNLGLVERPSTSVRGHTRAYCDFNKRVHEIRAKTLETYYVLVYYSRRPTFLIVFYNGEFLRNSSFYSGLPPGQKFNEIISHGT